MKNEWMCIGTSVYLIEQLENYTDGNQQKERVCAFMRARLCYWVCLHACVFHISHVSPYQKGMPALSPRAMTGSAVFRSPRGRDSPQMVSTRGA